jgi:hypothetical protein
MIGVGRDIECTGHAANELDRASVEPAATCNDRHTFLDSTLDAIGTAVRNHAEKRCFQDQCGKNRASRRSSLPLT